MRELQVPVLPRGGLGREPVGIKLPGADHHLPDCPVNLVAVYVHVIEAVIQADGLNLVIGVAQRAGVPEPHVRHRLLGGPNLTGLHHLVRRKCVLLNPIQRESQPRQLDRVGDKGGLARQLGRVNPHPLDNGRQHHQPDDEHQRRKGQSPQGST